MYEPEDAAYDAYVAEHGDPLDVIDAEQPAPAAIVLMHKGAERLEFRLYRTPRMIVETWPPFGTMPGTIREIPYGQRQNGIDLLDMYVNNASQTGWHFDYSWTENA